MPRRACFAATARCGARRRSSPTARAWRTSPMLPSGRFVTVSLGSAGALRFGVRGEYGCAIGVDGSLACWLGQGLAVESWAESWVRVPAGRFVDVSAGALCAVRVDGRLVCWGDDERNRVGLPGGGSWRSSRAGRALWMQRAGCRAGARRRTMWRRFCRGAVSWICRWVLVGGARCVWRVRWRAGTITASLGLRARGDGRWIGWARFTKQWWMLGMSARSPAGAIWSAGAVASRGEGDRFGGRRRPACRRSFGARSRRTCSCSAMTVSGWRGRGRVRWGGLRRRTPATGRGWRIARWIPMGG